MLAGMYTLCYVQPTPSLITKHAAYVEACPIACIIDHVWSERFHNVAGPIHVHNGPSKPGMPNLRVAQEQVKEGQKEKARASRGALGDIDSSRAKSYCTCVALTKQCV